MCGETRIPRDVCAGNTLPGETYHCDTGYTVSVVPPKGLFIQIVQHDAVAFLAYGRMFAGMDPI